MEVMVVMADTTADMVAIMDTTRTMDIMAGIITEDGIMDGEAAIGGEDLIGALPIIGHAIGRLPDITATEIGIKQINQLL